MNKYYQYQIVQDGFEIIKIRYRLRSKEWFGDWEYVLENEINQEDEDGIEVVGGEKIFDTVEEAKIYLRELKVTHRDLLIIEKLTQTEIIVHEEEMHLSS